MPECVRSETLSSAYMSESRSNLKLNCQVVMPGGKSPAYKQNKEFIPIVSYETSIWLSSYNSHPNY